jgi:tmRNA-binding protein
MNVIKANTVMNKILRMKVKITRRLKAVQSKERKDFHSGGFAKKKIKEAYDMHKSIDEPEEFIPFSKVASTKDKYPVLEYDKETFNKEIKKGFNLRLTDASEKYVLSELVNHKMLMTPEAYSKNKINAIEWEKYRKVLYNKTELKRLIVKRNKDQMLILESSPEYTANNDFVKEMLANCKGYQKETGKEVLGDKQIRISPHENYKKEIESLKNDRIDGLIGLHQANDKLKALMEAGFMDKSKDITQIFSIIRNEQITNTLHAQPSSEPKQLER